MKFLSWLGLILVLLGLLGFGLHRFTYSTRPQVIPETGDVARETKVLSISPRLSLIVCGIGVFCVVAGAVLRKT